MVYLDEKLFCVFNSRSELGFNIFFKFTKDMYAICKSYPDQIAYEIMKIERINYDLATASRVWFFGHEGVINMKNTLYIGSDLDEIKRKLDILNELS